MPAQPIDLRSAISDDIAIDSVAAFVQEMTRLMGVGQSPKPTLWFRGHSGRGWELRPGVLRSEFLNHPLATNDARDPEELERTMNSQFRRYAAGVVPPGVELVELYFLAQHHGLPTRLLDWTSNPLMALFVSLVDHPEEDGEVIVLAVDWRLSFDAAGPDEPDRKVPELPVLERDPLIVKTVRYLFDEGPRPDEGLVVPLRPDLRTGRMLQQEACFTLHMPGSGPIRQIPENSRRCRIPAGKKRRMLEELDAIGINWATLFRDLDHIARQVRHAWGIGGVPK